MGCVTGALLVLLPLCASAIEAEESPTDRTIQFLTNVHTGIAMKDSEWLSAKARSTGKISAYGGLSRMVKQTTALARSYNGLQSVEVLQVTEEGTSFRIRAEVKFFDEKRRKKSPAAAESVDMIWVFLVGKEEAKWKLTF